MTKFKQAQIRAEILEETANEIYWKLKAVKEWRNDTDKTDENADIIEKYDYSISVYDNIIKALEKMI